MPTKYRFRKTLVPEWSFCYPKNLGYRSMKAVHDAYTRWCEIIYDMVKKEAPIYPIKRPPPQPPPGFVSRHIKLVTRTGPKGIRYKTLAVPGGSKKGTPAYHALMAIYALHGYRREIVIRPKRVSALAFPVQPGVVIRSQKVKAPGLKERTREKKRGPARWIVTGKVVQPEWPKAGRNPWIRKIFERTKNMYGRLLKLELDKIKRKTKIKSGVKWIKMKGD